MNGSGQEKSYHTTGKITLIQDISPESPLDPINPDIIVEPQEPSTPGTSGPLSIDVATNFNFEIGKVTTESIIYDAYPTKVKNQVGTIVDRPHYVQVTDKRGGQKGWTLSITQAHQFRTADGHELTGSELKITNIETIGLPGTLAASPSYNAKEIVLHPQKMTNIPVVGAQINEGGGTWIARFGNMKTMGASIQLLVYGTSIQEADTYTTSLIWSLSSIPPNIE